MTEVGFDNVWEYVPNLTLRQTLLMIITGIVSLQDGLITMYPIFALYEPKEFKCLNDARYDIQNFSSNQTETFQFNGQEGICSETCQKFLTRSRRNAAPKTTKKEDDGSCYFKNFEYSSENSGCQACFDFENYSLSLSQNMSQHPSENDDESPSEWCDTFSYQDDSINVTLVTEHNLICKDQVKRESIFAVGNIGLAIGSFIGGSITDILGRKNVMFFITAISVISLGIQSVSPNLWAFTIFWTIAKICSQVKYLAYSSYTIEIISPKWRAFAGQMNHIYYAIGCILSSPLSYLYRDWQTFTYSVVAIHSPLLLFWFFIPESPRWLFLKKRSVEAEAALEKLVGQSEFQKIDRSFFEKMEKTERAKLETEDLANSQAIMTSMGSIAIQQKTETQTFGVKDIFAYRRMRTATLVVSATFFVIAMVYMGISYNAAELPGNIWLNNAINGILDAVANGIGIVLLVKFGRRSLLFWSLVLTGITYFGSEMVLLLTEEGEEPTEMILQSSRWMAFAGKFFISGSFSVVYTYTAELFPTNVRTVGLGLGSLGGGLGGIVAPYILTLQKPPISIKWLPAAIFSIFCILCAFFLLLLPETKGKPLYESVADAEKAWSLESDKKSSSRDNKMTSSEESTRMIVNTSSA